MVQKGFGIAGQWAPEMLKPLLETRKAPQRSPSPSPFMENLISLKQVRSAEDPNDALYQAIVHSSGTFENVNDVGLLYDPLSGDASGGWSIRIYDGTDPIVDTLGIAATKGKDKQGHNFSLLKPIFPFWWDLDLNYASNTSNLSSRTDSKNWDGTASTRAPVYVKAPGCATDQLDVTTPFKSASEVTTFIMPLAADPKTLNGICNSLLNFNGEYKFSVAAPYILMLLTQFGGMNSDNTQPLADSELSFVLPVNYTRSKNPKQSAPALAPLLQFVNGEWNAITDKEIYGRFDLQSLVEVLQFDQRR